MNSDALAYLAEKGLTLEEVIEFARLAERKKDATNAERQARYRAKRKDGKVTRYSNGVTPPIDRTHTPSDISPSGENQNDRARAKPEPFPKPDWAEDQVWADWLEIRKSKKCRNTATAHAGFLADIAKHSDDDWPPGRLLEYAVARSWASIHPPDEGRPNGQPARISRLPQPADNRGARPDPCLDMLRAARAAQHSPGDPGTDFPAWPALPALGTG